MNFAKFPRIRFLQNTSGRLFLFYSSLISFSGLLRTNATTVDADTENQTGAILSSCITVFPEKPYQPLSFKFPTSLFGNGPKERSFKPQCYQKYLRLHYDVKLDKAFYHTCIKAIKLGKISATKSEEAFTKTWVSKLEESTTKKYWTSKT